MKFNIAAIILGAGQSKRFGYANKLLSDFRGKPLLTHCLHRVQEHPFCQRILVTGHQHQQVLKFIHQDSFTAVYNDDYEQGMGTSIAKGIGAVTSNCDGALIFLGDMPLIAGPLIEKLLANFGPDKMVAPTFQERRGHPLLFARSFFPLLTQLTGDQGGKHIIESHPDKLQLIPWSNDSIFFDVDLAKEQA